MKHLLLSFIILLCATTAQAQTKPEGMKTHIGEYDFIHFNWDCYDRNFGSANDAVQIVFEYFKSIGQINADDEIVETLKPQMSKNGTEHRTFQVKGNSDMIEVAVSMKEGRPYFITGAFKTKYEETDSTASYAKEQRKAEVADESEAPVVKGEPVTSTVNTFFYGPQSVDYTLQGDSVVLYDAKRKIYGFAASDEDFLRVTGSREVPSQRIVTWADYLPLVADSKENAFAGYEFTDYQPKLNYFYCDFMSKSALTKHNVSCSVLTSDGDTLARGKFVADGNNFICQLDKPLLIDRYDLLYCLHVDDGGYKDVVNPLVIAGTMPSSADLGSMSAVSHSFTPTEEGLKSFRLQTVYPYYTLERKQPFLDAFWGIQRTVDFYRDVYGYNSFDNEGTEIYLFMNYKPNGFANTVCNSSASLQGQKHAVMIFGMGDMVRALPTAPKYSYMPLIALSIMGHEFTHVVVGQSRGKFNNNEGAALNESFADIMGTCIEAYVLDKEDATYKIGDNTWIPRDLDLKNYHSAKEILNSGIASWLRNMENPADKLGKPDPLVYEGENWRVPELTSIHANTGVQNHWFYLLSRQVGMPVARDLCFAEMLYYVSNHTDYKDVCEIAKAAAKYHGLAGTTFGDDSADNKLYTAVVDCWKECGLGDDATDIVDITASSQSSHKKIKNGQIVIVKNGVEYNVAGARLK